MSIRFNETKASDVRTVSQERTRCVLVLRGLPLGYRNGDEHEVLEKFVAAAVAVIESGIEVTENID